MAALEWVTDNIEELEFQAIYWMRNWVLNMGEGNVAASIVAMGWVQDGVSELEVGAIEQLSYIAYYDADIAESVVALGWVQDGIDVVEAEALDWISNIGDTSVAASVVDLGWVQDGVTELEVGAIEQLSYIAYYDADIAESVVALGWGQDGIDDLELQAIDSVNNFVDTDAASTVVALPWFQDGITDPEPEALEHLSQLANRSPDATRRIVGMPFMQTLTPLDVFAIRSLVRLATEHPAIFDRLAASPLLRLGITDDYVPILVTLAGVAGKNPDLILPLLNPLGTSREYRTMTAPLAGEIELVIIRTKRGAARSMDLLEQAVLSAEDFMGAPFPAQAVVLLYEDAVSPNAAGTNFGTHIAVRPKYDIDDGSFEAMTSPHILAHEVAHYYWRNNADWVDEGAL